jgi:predicted nucleotidyltransferase
LKKLKPALAEHYHVDTIGLFGSIVRDDFSPESSDVDIIVSFTRPVGDAGTGIEKKSRCRIAQRRTGKIFQGNRKKNCLYLSERPV